MYQVTCKQCGASVVSPSGSTDVLSCRCCAADHSHEAAANACPGGHNEGCPEPDNGLMCVAVTEAGQPCPGGHCHLDLPTCTVCRPCYVQWIGIVPVGAVS